MTWRRVKSITYVLQLKQCPGSSLDQWEGAWGSFSHFGEGKDVPFHWSKWGRRGSGIMLVLTGGSILGGTAAVRSNSTLPPLSTLVINIVAVTVSYLIDVSMNCSYPNPQSLPFVLPVLLSGHTWVEEGRRWSEWPEGGFGVLEGQGC